MKVLVATSKGQGGRRNDFMHATEGEPVGLSFECDGERVDGSCGCRRSFSGIDSRLATTTAEVVDLPVTREQFLARYLKEQVAAWGLDADDPEERLLVEAECEELLSIAGAMPLGAIVEKRGAAVQTRTAS